MKLTFAALIVAGLAGCTQMASMMHADSKSTREHVTLTGSSEVPPVTSAASGSGTVEVGSDRAVKASITVKGMTPTAAHIHRGAPGANGPVLVPLVKQGEDTFVTQDGAKLTEEQYRWYKDGETYVNVHSAKNPGGEVRAQLKGK